MFDNDSHLSDPELLCTADGELTRRRLRQVRAHLHTCWRCRTRMAELERTIGRFVTNYQSTFDPQTSMEDGADARFMLRLQRNIPAASNRGSAFWSVMVPHVRWAALAPLLLLVILAIGLFSGQWFRSLRMRSVISSGETAIVPDRRLTPGEAAFLSKTEVCQSQVEKQQRRIPQALKKAVFAEYGVKDAVQDGYEVDYLITPELGGSTSIRNLWPQPYFGPKWNAHVKDVLEDRLHELVCTGEVDLPTAQRDIATNWVDAYKKYLGNTPM